MSEQVASLVDTFLDDHWRSFFDLAQEHCDGVVERAEEALRELALPSPSVSHRLVRGAGRSQKSSASASTAADRTVFFQGLVDRREEARALKNYGLADVFEEQLDRNAVTVNRADRSWSSVCGLGGPVASPINQSDTLLHSKGSISGSTVGVEGGSVEGSRTQRDTRRRALSEERRSELIEPHLRQDALQSMLADPGGPAHQDFMRASGYFD